MVFPEHFKNTYVAFQEAVLTTFFPKRCTSCGEYGFWFCNRCERQHGVQHNLINCSYCSKPERKPYAFGKLCSVCKKELCLDGLLYWYSYKETGIQTALHTFKYRGVTGIAEAFGGYIEKRFSKIPYSVRPERITDSKNRIILIPLPLHARKKRARGFNQAELFAKELGSRFSWRIDSSLLVRKRSTMSQTKLTKEERKENMKNAFAIKKSIKADAIYILVDDVITTGTTIAEAARVLRQSGANQVWGLTIARG